MSLSASRYPPHFFFVTVAQQRFTEDDRRHPRLVYRDTFDPIGRNRAFDQCVLPEHFELLRRLLSEEFLLAARLAEVGQIPRSGSGDRFGLRGKLLKGLHPLRNSSAIPGIQYKFLTMRV